jgi:parallel beta-helix repeat protein
VAVAVVVVALVIVAPMTAVSVPALEQFAAQPAERIDSCGTIDEPGAYELSGDVSGSADDACIRITSSDVVVSGNGHTLAGGNASARGILIHRGENASRTVDGALENVTVRDVTVANWSDGVAVGTLDGGPDGVELSDVTARDNERTGVRLIDTENATVADVIATGNDDGVLLWETQHATIEDVTASGNGDDGVMLTAVSSENALRNVTATGNGADSTHGAGIYLSTDTSDNVLADARVADNLGTGVRFSDSYGNTLRDSVVADNDEAGVFGVPANDDALRNVTVRGNGGPVIAHNHDRSRFVADGLHLGETASVSFGSEPVGVERADATALPEPPRPLASDDGVTVSGVESGVTTTLSVADPSDSSLWRYDGSDWQQVDNATADGDAGTVSGSVTGDGTVVALESQDDQDDESEQNDQNGESDQDDEDDQNETAGQDDEDSEDEQNETGDETAGDGTLVVQATTESDFAYMFVVDGDAVRTETGNVAADSTDRVVENGDGTVTVIGSTGSNAGDAFEVDGEVVEFYTPAPDSAYALELEGEDVTDEIPAPNEDE